MKNGLKIVLGALLPLLPATVCAQTPPAGFNEQAAKAGGQADGISVACGKASMNVVKAHRARIKQRLGAKGLAPAAFDRLYDGAFDEVLAKTKSNPQQTTAACKRLETMGAPE